MNRSRHKITLALVFFGTVVLVPVALAQTVSAGGDATIEFVSRGPFIRAVRGLQMGTVFRPRTGTDNTILSIGCGFNGAAIVSGSAERPAERPGDSTRLCGQVDLRVGSADLDFTLEFAVTPTTALRDGSGVVIETRYLLTDSDGSFDLRFEADGTTSPTSGTISALAEARASFYIGADATLTPTTPFGNYTGTYEVLFTVVP